MARNRIYTDKERKERQKQAMKAHREKNGLATLQKTIAICLKPETHAEHLQTITAHGFKNAPDFWRYCIELLKADKLPKREPNENKTE